MLNGYYAGQDSLNNRGKETMDWETHVVLAGKVLEVCAMDTGAAIYSVLPAVDIEPIHYHRQYGHLLSNAHLILDAAIEILGSDEVALRDFGRLKKMTDARLRELEAAAEEAMANPALDRLERRRAKDRAYFYSRIAVEAERFVTEELAGAEKLLGEAAMRVSRDRRAAALALVSHPYFDTFNNPVSAFVPLAANYSAQWQLWKEIDYLGFKATFYNHELIQEFRETILGSECWTRRIDVSREPDPDIRRRIKEQEGEPFAWDGFIKAMIQRLGALAAGLAPNVIDLAIRNFFAELGLQEIVHADRELALCIAIESEIARFIRARYAA